MMIENSTPMNENAFGGYGEFVDTPDWTAEEWAEYDAQVAEEIAMAEEMSDSLEYFNPVEMGMYDDDPNPYHGDYSEM